MFKRNKLAQLMYNNFGGSIEPLNTSAFYAPLTHSIILTRGTGDPTYTRATTAYVTDFEGLLKQVPSGCARFSGARFVRNLVSTTSEDFTNAAWTKTTTTATATTLTATAGNATTIAASAITSVSQLHVLRVQMSRITGTGNIQLTLDNGSTWTTVTLTGSAQVFSISQTLANPQPGVRIVTDTDAINITKIQVEATVGQSNTNPSEYVSVGVLSAPYHGAEVDGCKFFNTENGNTVASSVVTEATGSAIASATLLGYLAEGARTNLCLQSQTFDVGAPWSADGVVVTANQIAAPDGTTTADLITLTATNNRHRMIFSPSVTWVTGVNTISVFVKAGTVEWFCLYAGSSHFASFHASGAGSVGTTGGADYVSSAIEALVNGWYRIQYSFNGSNTPSTDNLNVSVGSSQANLGTPSIAWTALGTETAYLWGAQGELGAFASSYIPTTTVDVARNADSDTYGTASNFSDTVGTMYAEVTYEVWANAVGSIVGSATQGMMPLTTNNGVKGFDGTNTVNGTAGVPSGTVKMAISWTGTTMKVCGNGTAVVSGTYDETWNLSSIGIGIGSSANVKNVRVWTTALTDAQLVTITT